MYWSNYNNNNVLVSWKDLIGNLIVAFGSTQTSRNCIVYVNGEDRDASAVDRNIQGRDLALPVGKEHEDESVENAATKERKY